MFPVFVLRGANVKLALADFAEQDVLTPDSELARLSTITGQLIFIMISLFRSMCAATPATRGDCANIADSYHIMI